ncbi:MAG: hypothetical protein KAT11_04555 [Phycisphaerae bacterium]|nr:hypothetical protein [Phycisphaerae bacterium]
MLHALLHNKLDESIPEPQRFEDALTSTIIGTLALVDAADVLTSWLARAKSADEKFGHVCPGAIRDIWFWPQLALAEPDVIIQLGDQLFVIEAKYRAGLHDGPANAEGEDRAERISDQLCRQWQSLHEPRVAHNRCASELRQAIASCRPALVLIVDARRMRRARRQFLRSVSQAGQDADLRILTWQSLYEILAIHHQQNARPRWSKDLCQYLENTGLQGFTGLRQAAPLGNKQAADLLAWRCPMGVARGLGSLFAIPSGSLEPVRSWNVGRSSHSGSGLFNFIRFLQDKGLDRLRPAQSFKIPPDMPARWKRFCDTSLEFFKIE